MYFVSKPSTSRGMSVIPGAVPDLYPQPVDEDPPSRISLGDKVHSLSNAPASLQSPPRAFAISEQSGACQRRSARDFSHALSDAFALSYRSADSTEHGKAGHLQHNSGSCSPGGPRRPYYVAALLCVFPPLRTAARMLLCTLHGVHRLQRAPSRLPAS